ncbi:unnamed protein product [Bemisia tabaci]|uniref:Uncharacterized protein n=1 Tax=Bemisia tabaci TaxID=7038 RepID=A0A9P0F8D1_BEMTA|nr:unnamed protein product [Bemisia tabaci]
MKVQFVCVLCILFEVTLSQVMAQENADRFRKFFSKGSFGSDLKFQQGDNLASFVIPNKHFVSRPYVYYYALNENEVVTFKPSKGKLFRKVYPKVIKLKEKMAKIKLLNRKHTSNYIGPVGGLVARMMVGAQLYFNLFFCNDKHYVYYLTYGAYSDAWYEDNVIRVSKKCPVRAPLTKDLFRKVLKAKTFTLRDAYEREKVISVKDWKDSRWSHPLRVKFNPKEEVKVFTSAEPATEIKSPMTFPTRRPSVPPIVDIAIGA